MANSCTLDNRKAAIIQRELRGNNRQIAMDGAAGKPMLMSQPLQITKQTADYAPAALQELQSPRAARNSHFQASVVTGPPVGQATTRSKNALGL